MKNVKFYTLVAVLCLLSNSTFAISKGDIKLQITTGSFFYVDHNNCGAGIGPRAAYLGIKTTNNTVVNQNNIAVEFIKYTDNIRYSLAGGQAVSQTIPNILAGANDTLFYYSTYPCFSCACSYPTQVIFKIMDLDDGTNYLDTLGWLDTQEQISSNGGGLVGSSQVVRQDPVGGIFAYRSTYNYPKLVTGDVVYLQPTTNIDFDASSFQFESAEVITSGANSAGGIPVGNCPMSYTINGTYNAFSITVEFRFRIKQNGSTYAFPYNSATSGAVGTKYVITNVPIYITPVNVLPVSLADFNIQPRENDVLLTWNTASEINNNYFGIERSLDGIKFQEIDRVFGKGNSNAGANYEFIDNNPVIGIVYYRLAQTDFDKTIHYSDIKSVLYKNTLAKNIRIFPNPTQGELFLTIDGSRIGNITLHIFDIRGQLIFVKAINENTSEAKLDLSDILQTGTYIVQGNMDTGESISQKIIIY